MCVISEETCLIDLSIFPQICKTFTCVTIKLNQGLNNLHQRCTLI